MKVFTVAVICVVAMATSEAFILPPFARFGAFPFGMMRPFPGVLHPAMGMPYPGFMGYGGAFPYGQALAAASMPGAVAAAATPDGAAPPAAQGSVYDAAPSQIGTYPGF